MHLKQNLVSVKEEHNIALLEIQQLRGTLSKLETKLERLPHEWSLSTENAVRASGISRMEKPANSRNDNNEEQSKVKKMSPTYESGNGTEQSDLSSGHERNHTIGQGSMRFPWKKDTEKITSQKGQAAFNINREHEEEEECGTLHGMQFTL